MVSTRSRAVEARGAGPSMDLAAILEAQAKMQQELANYRKRNVEEMRAMREDNTKLKKRVETVKHKGINKPECARSKVATYET